MGRPKCFEREDVLNKTIALFWRKGFTDTSLQDLEKETGLNKSSLYAEFDDKEGIFLESLKQYAQQSGAREILEKKPLGWKNIEDFLRAGVTCGSKKGCFMINTIREMQNLSPAVNDAIETHIAGVKKLLMENVRAVLPKANVNTVTSLIMTFNAGLCLEQNLDLKRSPDAGITDFMTMLKTH